jgi:hypothetical protein
LKFKFKSIPFNFQTKSNGTCIETSIFDIQVWPSKFSIPEDQDKLEVWGIYQKISKKFEPQINSTQIQTQFAS